MHRRPRLLRPAVVAYCQDGRSSLPAYLSTAEAAAILGVAVQHIHRLTSGKRILALPRGRYRVAAASVLAYREGRA